MVVTQIRCHRYFTRERFNSFPVAGSLRQSEWVGKDREREILKNDSSTNPPQHYCCTRVVLRGTTELTELWFNISGQPGAWREAWGRTARLSVVPSGGNATIRATRIPGSFNTCWYLVHVASSTVR